MRRKLLLSMLIALAWLVLVASAADPSSPRLLRVSLVEGDVTYQRTDLDKWVDLSINTPILEGDKVWVGRDGRTEIEFEDGSTARLAENTIAEFSRLGSSSDPMAVQVRVSGGVASFEVKSPAGPFTVETPMFGVTVSHSGIFRVDVDSDGSSRLVVFEGRAEIQSQVANLILRGGETFRLLSSDPERYYLGTNYERDEWDQWSFGRSEYLARLGRERRTTDSPAWNSAELDAYGSWYDVPEYGRVWRPYCDAGWAPFRTGRWVWYNDFGWTWVSYEPWGWLPYHYGRWNFANNLGWCWVPGGMYDPWCPGAVSWVSGGTWVGWCPLGPHELWRPTGGPYHGAKVFVSQNYRYRESITYLPRETFVNGTPVDGFRPPTDPIRGGGRILSGQPDLTPTALSRMPITVRMATRKYNNDDLIVRQSQRDQVVQAGSTLPSSSSVPAGVEPRRSLREQMTTQGPQVQQIGSGSSSSPGVRVITGGSGGSLDRMAAEGVRTYEGGSSARESVRSQQRDRLEGSPETARSGIDSRTRGDAGDERVQRIPANSTDSRVYSSSPGTRDSGGEDVRQTLRSRSGESSDRYNGRTTKGWTFPTYEGSRGSAPAPARFEPPAIRPDPVRSPTVMAPPSLPSRVSPPAVTAPRESTFQTRTESRSSGTSTQDSRSAAHARMSR